MAKTATTNTLASGESLLVRFFLKPMRSAWGKGLKGVIWAVALKLSYFVLVVLVPVVLLIAALFGLVKAIARMPSAASRRMRAVSLLLSVALQPKQNIPDSAADI